MNELSWDNRRRAKKWRFFLVNNKNRQLRKQTLERKLVKFLGSKKKLDRKINAYEYKLEYNFYFIFCFASKSIVIVLRFVHLSYFYVQYLQVIYIKSFRRGRLEWF